MSKVEFRVFFSSPLCLSFQCLEKLHCTSAEVVASAGGKWRSLSIWDDATYWAEGEDHSKALTVPGCSCTPLGILHLLEQQCFGQATPV